MNADHLATMANRIAEFFAVMPDHTEALDGVSNHIVKFWEPRMRRQLLEMSGNAHSTQLHALVREAFATGRL